MGGIGTTFIGNVFAIGLAAVLAGCGPDADVAAGSGAGVDPAAPRAVEEPTAAPAALDAPAEEAPSALPPEIYYDLTGFDWYRRGEPLIVDGQPFQPAGPPRRIAADDLSAQGAHGGVTYYARSDSEAPDPAVYVPVFEGYWLPFQPTGAALAE